MKAYLDNAATTPLCPEVLKEMLPYFSERFGNASSLHSYGREALKAVDIARDKIAKLLNASPSEIFFTSGGTESDNWAIRGAVGISKKDKKHIVSTAIEHPAVRDTLIELKESGCEVTFVGVDKNGIVNVNDIKNAVTENTVLVSVMTANNEIGSLQPIAEIGAFCRENKIPFHTDAVQGAGAVDLNVKALKVDFLSLSAHKFYGPKGVGVLYIRQGARLKKMITGGHQERNQRAGTTNVAFIAGMAKAYEIACRDMDINNKRESELRDYFIKRATSEISGVTLNGGLENRLPNNANLSFFGIEGESLLILLDLHGVAVSSGSACSSGSLEPSHVIASLGNSPELAHSSIRVSLSKYTTKEEIDYALDILKDSVKKLREMSPLFKQETGKGSYV